MSEKIKKITAEEILDSRGNPTLAVSVKTETAKGVFSVPSGASTGTHEAHELRDGDITLHNGLGVKKAIEKIEKIISPALLGFEVSDQKKIDSRLLELDGTPNKTNLGGNSMVGVSIACSKASANSQNLEVFEYLRGLENILPSDRKTPLLFMNLINGGKHANNGLAFQEYHVVPNTENVKEAVDIGIKIQNTLKEIILKELGEESIVLGDEGGFAPKTNDIRKPLLYLTEAIKQNNLQDKVHLALDVAASSFYKPSPQLAGGYGFYEIGEKHVSFNELMSIYDSLITEFNLFSIEDPFEEEDFDNFSVLLENHSKLKVVGDDLTVTNKSRLKEAVAMETKSINAMIIKPNQIGTLSETLGVMKLARENGVECIVSHRSGETDDDFIADLAFAFHCFGLKAGAPLKSERAVKYNRLAKISGRNELIN